MRPERGANLPQWRDGATVRRSSANRVGDHVTLSLVFRAGRPVMPVQRDRTVSQRAVTRSITLPGMLEHPAASFEEE